MGLSCVEIWGRPLRKAEWVVYAKPPFGGPEAVLAYLARYTHRVAIANSRLIALDGNGVTFTWRDYRTKTQQCWLHQLPKTRAPVGPRINLTFRRMGT